MSADSSFIEIGILFLAYDGIHCPNIWKQWFSYLKDHNIIVRSGIVSDIQRTVYPSEFLDTNRLDIDIKTEWCNISLVKATVLGYKEILKKYDDIKYIFLVSGTDIPIGTYTTLREIITRNKSTFAVVNNLKDNEEDTQWIHLTRKHASMMSSFVDWDILNLRDTALSCPDEYVPRMIATHQKWENEIIDDSLTDMERKNDNDKSPIVFNNWFSKYKVCRSETQLYMSLNNIFEEYIDTNQTFMFFRKVSSKLRETSNSHKIQMHYPWFSNMNNQHTESPLPVTEPPLPVPEEPDTEPYTPDTEPYTPDTEPYTS